MIPTCSPLGYTGGANKIWGFSKQKTFVDDKVKCDTSNGICFLQGEDINSLPNDKILD